ncbi:hypothetical protein K2173_024940 [Erythroxylum novogranatense]|uniref:Pentatricopeptide repeat-containing protein n=1 Tax=Erythroxylum novogranatense TaxID=1862640 RepID=A0AAV8UCT2_9ROSI|nr:hypothetical protein K2173_024940 [Erythroxylum novogranatense]
MLLQPSLHHQQVSLSSSFSYSGPLRCDNPRCALPRSLNCLRLPVICSISQLNSYGTVDYERKPVIKWNAIYKRISLMENPELGSGSVLDQWELEGKKLTKWELCRVIKELRKFKRYKQALEIYDWMSNKRERFRLSPSDAAIQLDLIAKVRGVSAAESFFMTLSNVSKDRRIYGALLNAYVRDKMREKAESLIEKMRNKGYTTHALPFNVMMTLYMNLKEYDNVDKMVSEMMERSIKLDIYSYNIWLSSCGSQGSIEKMEEVFEKMRQDRNINPNWTTFSTMATMYIRMGQTEKAEDCLRKVESRITGRLRIPYHYLISLYGNIGNKEEVHRVWNNYKSIFPSIPNLGYHAIISSLLRSGDIEGAEKLFEEWLSVKTHYDPRISNLLMTNYVKEGSFDKAESMFQSMSEWGGKPNSNTWEILADRHISERNVSEALSCWKEAFAADGSKSWKPKPASVLNFYKLCQEEDELSSKEALENLLTQPRYLEDKAYASLIGLSSDKFSTLRDFIDDENGNESEENDESEMHLQLESSV